MLIVFLIFSLVFVFINYLIADRDMFNPAFLFSAVNFFSALMCVVLQKQYNAELHVNTFFVLLSGLFLFFLINTWQRFLNSRRKGPVVKIELEYMQLQNGWVVLFILLELVVSYSLAKYVQNVASAYFGGGSNFVMQIAQYNTLAKFKSTDLAELGINMPAIVSHGSNLCKGVVFILIAIEVNNYLIKKKFDKLICVAIVIRAVSSLFTGSRGDLFEYATAVLIDFVILSRRKKGYYKKGNLKFMVRILLISTGAITGIFLLSLAVGRAISYDGAWYNTFFGYLGAPILNLDSFLQTDFRLSSPLGRESFVFIYNYIGNSFGISEYQYSPNLPFIYHNGLGTGNVYTMYYPLIEDFGFFFFIPFVLIIAIYYSLTYSRISNLRSRKNPIGMRFFVYSYLFNSLIMLMFADRFYTSITRLYSIRMFVWMFIFWKVYKAGWLSKKRIKTRNARVKVLINEGDSLK